MRTAQRGERFLGIGMIEHLLLRGGEIVISDDEKLVAVYPYRDADASKTTRNLQILVCGVPGIDEKLLVDAGKVAIDLVTEFCGGEAGLD